MCITDTVVFIDVLVHGETHTCNWKPFVLECLPVLIQGLSKPEGIIDDLANIKVISVYSPEFSSWCAEQI